MVEIFEDKLKESLNSGETALCLKTARFGTYYNSVF